MDAVSFLVLVFVVFVLFVGGLILVAILLSLFRKSSDSKSNCRSVNSQPVSDNQIEKDIIEDGEGDGLMLFDDPI